MSGHGGSDAESVAQAHDESDDRLRSDGVESCGGRIVEHDRRPIDQSAGDGDAAAHATGKFGREFIDGVFHLYEAERFADVQFDLIFGHVFFAKTEGYVVGDVERIEERAFLKYEADVAAKIEELDFVQLGEFVTHDPDAAGIGTQQAGGEFEDERFSRAALAEEDFRFAGSDFEGDAAKDLVVLVAEMHLIEDDERFAGRGLSHSVSGYRQPRGQRGIGAQQRL
jgi:hypothetical protein